MATRKPEITLDATGIYLGDDFYAWQDVREEQVVIKSTCGQSDHSGIGGASARSGGPYFTFYHFDYYIAIPLTALDISITQMDRLLYLCRGRYERASSMFR